MDLKATLTFDKLPKTLDEMKALPGDVASLKDPYAVTALCVLAYEVYHTDPDASIEMIKFLRGPREFSAYDAQFTKDRFPKGSAQSEYLMRSYFEGATPDNNYTPAQPCTIKLYENPYSRDQFAEGYLKVFLRSGGADTERYITLRTKASTGEWFVWNESGLLVGIKTAKADDPWA
ncbi:MAG: hypothetical protein J5499_03980 [Lachnospiraceae bacterium]|nr:hypothetical protein [Lachnospiraceae bacterium]MBQ6091453.1 hypothetical protein [Lachnospiraceae bacterium]MBR5368616.1 hypothetical protein [Lachnospiraceae bacterium]